MATLTFGPFRLDTRALELRRDGQRVQLAPQPCQALVVLASSPGRLITRDEFRQVLWPEGIHVCFDPSLNSCLKQIRAALGDSVNDPGYVETLQGRGYRFIAAVNKEEERNPWRRIG